MGLAGATILQVVPELSAGGVERTTIEVAAALAEAGARPLVASAGGRLERELKAAGGQLLPLSSMAAKNPIQMIGNAQLLSQLVSRQQVSLVHARSRAPAWSAWWAARQKKVPFVTTYHGVYNARTPPKKFYNSIMARGDVVIANSEFTAAHIRQQHPAAANRIVTIPRGVDLDVFRRGAVDEQRIRLLAREWDMDLGHGTPPVILLPARLTRWKGHVEAIEAAALLAARNQGDWRLVFAGDSQGRTAYVTELGELIAARGLNDRVALVGHCNDMPAAFAVSTLVIAPSIEPEAFGRVAAEAGAMETPVIGSDMGGQREVIAHNETGMLVPPGDAEALAEAMNKCLAGGPTLRIRFGAAARARITESYSVAALQKATLSVYEHLLGRKHD
jgi:glycosyltransferase involved in cell wall biosynthesis